MTLPIRLLPIPFLLLTACGSSNGDGGGVQSGSSASGGSSGVSGSGDDGTTSGSGGSGQTSGTATTVVDGSGGTGARTGSTGSTGSTSGGAAGTGGSGGQNTTEGSTAAAGAGGSESCEGYPNLEYPSCMSSDDCTGAYCHFPGDGPVCGAACLQERECEGDEDCEDGVCAEFVAGCCPEGTLSSACQPECTEGSCPDGTLCSASGHCECTDDGCGVNESCEAVGDGPRRCLRRSCTDESECDCGVCSDGHCTPPPEVGFCQPPVP